MVVKWVLEAGASLVLWVIGLFPPIPSIPWPAPLVVTIPTPPPFDAAGLNAWSVATLAVAAVLVVGRLLQWVYGLIPFKAT